MNSPELYLVATDASGNPVSGALLRTTVAGSTTVPKALYADAGCTQPLDNPLAADGAGVFPQFYMEDGGYRFDLRHPDDSQLRAPRDYVFGAKSSSNPVTLDHKVLPISADGTAGYLINCVANDGSIDIYPILSGTPLERVGFKLSAASLAEMGKVSPDGIGVAGFLGDVLRDGVGTVATSVIGTDRYMRIDVLGLVATALGKAPGYLQDVLEAGTGITLTVDGNRLRVDAAQQVTLDHKVAQSLTDSVPGFLASKIKAGAGITLTVATDSVDGEQLWIDSKANFWLPVQSVNSTGAGQHYAATDSDALINIAAVSGYVDLPAPTYQYRGRRYVIQGRSLTTSVTVTDGSSPILGVSTVTGYGRLEAYCLPGTDGVYRWVGA